MAEIIKLDEYLEKHRHNILKATVAALGMDPNKTPDIEYMKKVFDQVSANLTSTEQHELEMTLVSSLEAHDAEVVRDLLGLNKITWENDSMDHVDIAKGYNYRCLLQNETARNNMMDWLEESGFDYLIDNDGRFAINCLSRESQYSANVKFEQFKNKWDRPSSGTNVDPEIRKTGLGNIKRPALEGGVIQRGKGMSEDQKDSTSFKDTSHSMSPFSDETRDDEEDEELKEIKSNFDDLVEGKRKTAKQREKEAKEKLADKGSVEKGIGAKGLQKNKQKAGPQDTKKGKKGYDKKEGRKKVDVNENEMTELFGIWIQRLNEHYNSNNKLVMTHIVRFLKDDLELNEEETQEFLNDCTDELNEEVMGPIMMMPQLARMKELAGLEPQCGTESPDSSMMTVTIKPVAPDPGTPNIKEMPGAKEAKDLMVQAFDIFDRLGEAKGLMTKVFDIFNRLGPEERNVFKDCLIGNIMGTRVVENITETTILELKRVDEPLTNVERISIAKMLNKHWKELIFDIDQWKNRTNDLDKVELAILLLRKVSQKLGQGLV